MMKSILFSERLRQWAVLFLLALPMALPARVNNGDVNHDGEVSLADVNEVVNTILSNGSSKDADINGDGEITVADANEVINIIFNGGINQRLLEVCEEVVEIDQSLSEYYTECETLEELLQHSDEIEAFDCVEYVFYTDNTMYVVIKDFGTISYSFFPDPEESSSLISIHHNSSRLKANQSQTHTLEIEPKDAKAGILFQMSKDEKWAVSSDLCDWLDEYFGDVGITSKVERSLSVEFFQEGIFDYDYLFLLTHGEYELDPIQYSINPNYRPIHWLFTTVELSNNPVERALYLYNLRSRYDEVDVTQGTLKEKHNGKEVNVRYLKVSDHFIESSDRSFNHPGKAVVLSASCESLKGPGIYGNDSIDLAFATVFEQKGAGIYLGYDHTNSRGDEAGIQYFCNLLSGMSIRAAYDNLQFDILHDKEYNDKGTKSWWADLIPYMPSQELNNSCIIKPHIDYSDDSNENQLSISLNAEITCGSFYFLYNKDVTDYEFDNLSKTLKYGFELCENSQFTNVVRLNEMRVGDDGCVWGGEVGDELSVSFSQSLTYDGYQTDSKIEPNTKYWVRAYVYDGLGYNYSEPISFTTASIKVPDVPAEAIDLGLPSGTLWAAYNVGATKPEEYGGYYSWGETETKETYYWDNYTHCDGTKETCHDIGEDITGTEYDVAHVKWGGDWQMPSKAQVKEIINNCTKKAATRNGIKGFELTGPNGNKIFFPAAGYATGNVLLLQGESCIYNSGTLYPGDLQQSMCLIIEESDFSCFGIWNSLGHTVRPVMNAHYDEPQSEVIRVGNTGLSIKMIGVQGGSFMMGATPDQGDNVENWEKPVHKVTLSSYKIAEVEVTQSLWAAVMGSNPSSFTGDLNRPVETINWDEAQQFITKLNQMTGRKFRLPTEAEWEFAARGGNKSNHCMYSGSNYVDDVAWHPGNSDNSTHPVAQKMPNELGLYDMSGNVWEFCQDWYSYYSNEEQYNPTGAADGSLNPYRIIRGGSWLYQVDACRVAYRNICNPSTTYRGNSTGFRLAMDAEN